MITKKNQENYQLVESEISTEELGSTFFENHIKAEIETIKKIMKQNGKVYDKDNRVIYTLNIDELDAVLFLIENNPSLTDGRSRGFQWALENEHMDMMKYLFESSPDIYIYNHYYLEFSVNRNHVSVVEFLYENYENKEMAMKIIKKSDNITLIEIMKNYKNKKELKEKLEEQLNINEQSHTKRLKI